VAKYCIFLLLVILGANRELFVAFLPRPPSFQFRKAIFRSPKLHHDFSKCYAITGDALLLEKHNNVT
jgi:hypothetical protein